MGAGKSEDTGGRVMDFPGWSQWFSTGPANLKVGARVGGWWKDGGRRGKWKYGRWKRGFERECQPVGGGDLGPGGYNVLHELSVVHGVLLAMKRQTL